jgi:CheY-like chemotaxis protein
VLVPFGWTVRRLANRTSAHPANRVPSAPAALAVAQVLNRDIVLLDIRMPGMGG